MNSKNPITIENYEIYIVDYLDGKLSESQQEALFIFLNEHPDLKADFEFFSEVDSVFVKTNSVIFPHPEKLKKTAVVPVGKINESNYQNYFIAYHENDLNAFEQKKLSVFLEKNENLVPEFKAFKCLKMVPNQKIVFENKKKLKRSLFHIRYTYYSIASIAAIFLVLFLLNTEENLPTIPNENIFTQVVNNENTEETDTTSSIGTVIVLETNTPQQRIVAPATLNSNLKKTVSVEQKTTDIRREEIQEIMLFPQPSSGVIVMNNNNGFEITKILEADVVAVKTLENVENEKPRQTKSFWNVLSWGVKQYNRVSNDPVTVTKVENLTTNEVAYYFSYE